MTFSIELCDIELGGGIRSSLHNLYPLTFYGLTGCALTPPNLLCRRRERDQSMHLSISLWTSSAVQGACSPHVTVPPAPPKTTTTPHVPQGQVMNTYSTAEVKNVAKMPLFPFARFRSRSNLSNSPRALVCVGVCAVLTPKCHGGGMGDVCCGGCDTLSPW